MDVSTPQTLKCPSMFCAHAHDQFVASAACRSCGASTCTCPSRRAHPLLHIEISYHGIRVPKVTGTASVVAPLTIPVPSSLSRGTELQNIVTQPPTRLTNWLRSHLSLYIIERWDGRANESCRAHSQDCRQIPSARSDGCHQVAQAIRAKVSEGFSLRDGMSTEADIRMASPSADRREIGGPTCPDSVWGSTGKRETLAVARESRSCEMQEAFSRRESRGNHISVNSAAGRSGTWALPALTLRRCASHK